jgi:hypothetical protein
VGIFGYQATDPDHRGRGRSPVDFGHDFVSARPNGRSGATHLSGVRSRRQPLQNYSPTPCRCRILHPRRSQPWFGVRGARWQLSVRCREGCSWSRLGRLRGCSTVLLRLPYPSPCRPPSASYDCCR